MHIGVMAHFTDLTPSPAEVAIAAEERGFESLFVTEHTHIPVREFIEWWGGQPMPDEYKRLHDPLIALATAASVTSRIKLGTGVLVIAQREPIATGKQLASLDRLSGGRLVCGVGYGWEADELADHGISWSERKPAFREHMQAIRALWADDESSYHGDRVRFGPCWSYPKPLQQPGPPVLLGAVGNDSSFNDIVTHCDGWMPIEGTEPIGPKWQQLREVADRSGRDPSKLQLTVYASAGEPSTLDDYRKFGAHRAVVALDAAAGLDAVRRQLDDISRRSLIA
jgi:probable F420-dependent oxidoreductase